MNRKIVEKKEVYTLSMVTYINGRLYRFQSLITLTHGRFALPPGYCTKGHYESETGLKYEDLPELPYDIQVQMGLYT